MAIRLMGLPDVALAPEVRLERTVDEVVLWFLGADDERPVQRVAVPRYTLGDAEDIEAAELGLLAQLQQRGHDARRLAPRVEPDF